MTLRYCLGDVLLGALGLLLLLHLLPLLLPLHTHHPVLPNLSTTEVYCSIGLLISGVIIVYS